MQLPAALADEMRHDVARDAEHRRDRPVRGTQRRSGIQQPRSGNDGVDAGTAGGFGVAVGHVPRALLVAGGDEAQRLALARQCVVEIVHVRAGNPEHGVHAVCDQRCGDRLAGGHEGHGPRELLCLDELVADGDQGELGLVLDAELLLDVVQVSADRGGGELQILLRSAAPRRRPRAARTLRTRVPRAVPPARSRPPRIRRARASGRAPHRGSVARTPRW